MERYFDENHYLIRDLVRDFARNEIAPVASGPVFERLRSLRSDLARKAAIPAYCVLTDRTLGELAARLPGDEAALLDVPGIGPAKVAKYGAALLAALRDGEA